MAKRGRKQQWFERLQVPLAEGKTDKIDSLLDPGEFRLDFIREAIDEAIKKRERRKRKEARHD